MTQEIKLQDFYILDSELNGVVNRQTGEKIKEGILSEELPLIAKYWISRLNDTVQSEIKKLDTERDNLIKKYGTESDNGSISIPISIGEGEEQKVNPDFIKFNEEFNELLAQTTTIEYKPIKLSSLEGVKSTNNYKTLFQFVEE